MGRGGKTIGSAETASMRGGAPIAAAPVSASRAQFIFADKLESALLADREYVYEMSDISKTHPIGRGGRFDAALRDINRAKEILEAGDPAKEQLANTMLSNATWYVGRILAKFDPDSVQLDGVKKALREYAEATGPKILEGLQNADLITPEEADEFARDIGEKWVDAFASDRPVVLAEGKHRPSWAGLMIMHRAQAAKERIALRETSSSELDAFAERGLKQCEKSLSHARRYVDDPEGAERTYDFISAQGPSGATDAEIVADTLTNTDALALNERLHSNGPVKQCEELVAETTGQAAGDTVVAVSDRAWLDQTSDYAAKIHSVSNGGIIAIHNPSIGILLQPEVSRDEVIAHEQGGFAETIAHELVHSTQPKRSSGKMLKDIDGPGTAPVANRHAVFEEVLLEGATQEMTNMMHDKVDGSWARRSNVYPSYTILLDEIAEKVEPESKLDLLRDVSNQPRNQRLGFVSSLLCGSDSEEDKRRVMEPLLKAVYDHGPAISSADYSDNAESSYRAAIRAALLGL